MGRMLMLAVLGSGLAAAGTEPKAKPEEYPVQANFSQGRLGADFLVHSIPAGGQTFFSLDFLVVEVAVFPTPGQTVSLNPGQFTLRVNGKKDLLFAQSPGSVAASLKYPDWRQRPSVEMSGGIGAAEVVLGRAPAVSRFPGDPVPSQRRLPKPPVGRGGPTEPNTSEPIETVLERSGLPAQEVRYPFSGLLFFAFQGKAKTLKKVELLFTPDRGDTVVIPLR